MIDDTAAMLAIAFCVGASFGGFYVYVIAWKWTDKVLQMFDTAIEQRDEARRESQKMALRIERGYELEDE